MRPFFTLLLAAVLGVNGARLTLYSDTACKTVLREFDESQLRLGTVNDLANSARTEDSRSFVQLHSAFNFQGKSVAVRPEDGCLNLETRGLGSTVSSVKVAIRPPSRVKIYSDRACKAVLGEFDESHWRFQRDISNSAQSVRVEDSSSYVELYDHWDFKGKKSEAVFPKDGCVDLNRVGFASLASSIKVYSPPAAVTVYYDHGCKVFLREFNESVSGLDIGDLVQSVHVKDSESEVVLYNGRDFKGRGVAFFPRDGCFDLNRIERFASRVSSIKVSTQVAKPAPVGARVAVYSDRACKTVSRRLNEAVIPRLYDDNDKIQSVYVEDSNSEAELYADFNFQGRGVKALPIDGCLDLNSVGFASQASSIKVFTWDYRPEVDEEEKKKDGRTVVYSDTACKTVLEGLDESVRRFPGNLNDKVRSVRVKDSESYAELYDNFDFQGRRVRVLPKDGCLGLNSVGFALRASSVKVLPPPNQQHQHQHQLPHYVVKNIYFMGRDSRDMNPDRFEDPVTASSWVADQWASWGFAWENNETIHVHRVDVPCGAPGSIGSRLIKLGYKPERNVKYQVFTECFKFGSPAWAAGWHAGYAGGLVKSMRRQLAKNVPIRNDIGAIGHELGHTFGLGHENCNGGNPERHRSGSVMCNNGFPYVTPLLKQQRDVALARSCNFFKECRETGRVTMTTLPTLLPEQSPLARFVIQKGFHNGEEEYCFTISPGSALKMQECVPGGSAVRQQFESIPVDDDMPMYTLKTFQIKALSSGGNDDKCLTATGVGKSVTLTTCNKADKRQVFKKPEYPRLINVEHGCLRWDPSKDARVLPSSSGHCMATYFKTISSEVIVSIKVVDQKGGKKGECVEFDVGSEERPVMRRTCNESLFEQRFEVRHPDSAEEEEDKRRRMVLRSVASGECLAVTEKRWGDGGLMLGSETCDAQIQKGTQTLFKLNANLWRLSARNTELCLDTRDSSSYVFRKCPSSSSTRKLDIVPEPFNPARKPGVLFTIKSKSSQRCLDASSSNGRIHQERCVPGASAQQFEAISLPSARFLIRLPGTNKCFTTKVIYGRELLVVSQCYSLDINQRFKRVDSLLRLINSENGKCLSDNVDKAHRQLGTKFVHMRRCGFFHHDEEFYIEPVSQ